MMLLMTRSFVLLSVLLSCLGCQPEEPSNIFQVSSEFSDEQFEVMQKEVNKLCEATVGAHCLILTRLETENKIVSVQIAGSLAGDATREIVQGEVRYLIRLDDSSKEPLADVFRHEIGHVSGCWRHLSEGNVMYKVVSSVHWTDEDIDCMD